MTQHRAIVPIARAAPVPRRGLRRPEAAAYVGVGATKFDQMVGDGRMPQPFAVDGCVLWDLTELDQAFDDLRDSGRRLAKAQEDDGWDDV